jgi:antitoxin YefM
MPRSPAVPPSVAELTSGPSDVADAMRATGVECLESKLQKVVSTVETITEGGVSGSHTGRRRTRNRTMPETLTVTDAKARLSELVAAVAATQDHVDITRNGEPAAVLVSHAELAALRETIAVLSDPAAVADIREGEADVLAGKTVDAEELRRLRSPLS